MPRKEEAGRGGVWGQGGQGLVQRGRERPCGVAIFTRNFPGGSAGKEPACRAGDPGSVPGLG